MDSLPLDVVEKVFEFLPLKDVCLLQNLNHQCDSAANQQLKLRSETLDLSTIHFLSDSSLQTTFDRIGPIVRHMTVDLISGEKWIPWAIASCPNLESLKYVYHVDGVCYNDLKSLKSLSFIKVECDEEMIHSFLTNRCANLQSLNIDRTDFMGFFLMVAPRNIRRLNITNSNLKFIFLVDYLRINQNIEHLCVQMDEDRLHLSTLLENLPKVKSLGLIGRNRLVTDGFEHFAKLSNLVKLEIQVTSANFCHYPDAIDDTQQLQEMNLTIDGFAVTHQFASSFAKFRHLEKLSIFIGLEVSEANLLLFYLNQLGKHGKLESLVLAGFTQNLDLDETNSQLRNIKKLRVCNPSNCKCRDHLAIIYGSASQ